MSTGTTPNPQVTGPKQGSSDGTIHAKNVTKSAIPNKPLPRDVLIRRIKNLGPWHMNIQLNEEINTGQVFSDDGKIMDRSVNDGVSLLSLRDRFIMLLKKMYPEGLDTKRFLDCACNSGGYCFWARELNARAIYGFDVREHWIKQARFVKNHRTVAPTDRIAFKVSDVSELPNHNLQPFDIVNFKGIFYHLPDPIASLKKAADLTREIMIFNTSTLWGENDGYLKVGWESTTNVMSGVHGLKWYPTGPEVLGQILSWVGFTEMKLMFYKQHSDQPHLGRVEIIASKVPGKLRRIGGKVLESPYIPDEK